MTRRELIDFCLTLPLSYEDYPFDRVADDHAWTVMRHRGNKKSFALIFEREGRLFVNLKCDPLEAGLLRQAFSGVTPAYHMNKAHWNSVALDGDVAEQELMWRVARSYDLIRPKKQHALQDFRL
jgi:predicted DNA-binding protein (MmcQ/YjbR family)